MNKKPELKYPTIYNQKFGESASDGLTEKEAEKFTECDSAINTMLMRGIVDLMDPSYNPEMDGFTTGFSWRVIVRDQHDDEASPHYILDIGEDCVIGEHEVLETISVRYCDNHSCRDRKIAQDPGRYKVIVMGDHNVMPLRDEQGKVYSYVNIAKYVARVYYEALVACLPDYFIVVAKAALRE